MDGARFALPPAGTAVNRNQSGGSQPSPPNARLPAPSASQDPGILVPSLLLQDPEFRPESTSLSDPGFWTPALSSSSNPGRPRLHPWREPPSPTPFPGSWAWKDRSPLGGLPGPLVIPLPQLPPRSLTPYPGTFFGSSPRLCLAISLGLCGLGSSSAGPPTPLTASSGVRAAGAGSPGQARGKQGRRGRRGRGRGFRGR